MKCDLCDHQRVCWIYLDHIIVLKEEEIEITIDKCPEFDETK